MSSSSKIEWTEATWNPVTGCTKVSQGCKHCYAERLAPKVFAGQMVNVIYVEIPSGLPRPRVFTDVLCHPERLDAPLRWRTPKRIFVNSMSDLFHEDVPDEFILQVFDVMRECANGWTSRLGGEKGKLVSSHTFQILTKRAARMADFCTRLRFAQNDGRGLYLAKELPHNVFNPMRAMRNVWLGVSVEDQETADERIPLLLQTPAAVRFLSCEPLLGPIELRDPQNDIGEPRFSYLQRVDGEGPRIDWVIAGGESGPNARPTHPDWFRSLRDQCAAASVPYFFKQWGEWGPCETEVHADERGHEVYPLEEPVMEAVYDLGDRRSFKVIEEHGIEFGRFGKKLNGRTLDGRIHDEYPIQETT